MIATSARTSSGCTSGVGFAIAKTIASVRHRADRLRRHRAGDRDADEHVRALEQLVGRPRRSRGFVRSASAMRAGSRSVRPRWIAPCWSQHDDVADALREQDLRARRARRAGAGRPRRARPRRACPRPGARSAARPARTIAVPCWSSWKTGMSSSARSRRSISKQRGAEMSSRLMPPNVGATAFTGDDLVDVLRGQAEREGVDAGELLEQQRLALHDGHRRLRPDVAEPEHRRAVGHDGDRVALDREGPGRARVLVDRLRHARDARRVGHREVVAGLDRHLRRDVDLAAQVQQERAVGDAATLTPSSARPRPRPPRRARRRRTTR